MKQLQEIIENFTNGLLKFKDSISNVKYDPKKKELTNFIDLIGKIGNSRKLGFVGSSIMIGVYAKPAPAPPEVVKRRRDPKVLNAIQEILLLSGDYTQADIISLSTKSNNQILSELERIKKKEAAERVEAEAPAPPPPVPPAPPTEDDTPEALRQDLSNLIEKLKKEGLIQSE